jgi:hypothetical protein
MEALAPFGVSTYALWAAVNPERVDPLTSMLSNWSDEWLGIYMSGRKYLYDPIVQEAVKQPGNFFWRNISSPATAQAGELFLQARQFGMIDGFTMSARQGASCSGTKWRRVSYLCSLTRSSHGACICEMSR